jgi:hypothetical protein
VCQRHNGRRKTRTVQNDRNDGSSSSSPAAILPTTSTDHVAADPDEVNDTISCMIDNNQVNIDARTISPFKCVISSAGHLPDDDQKAVIAIYGCWLPDHRLREYRYIMNQLF